MTASCGCSYGKETFELVKGPLAGGIMVFREAVCPHWGVRHFITSLLHF